MSYKSYIRLLRPKHYLKNGLIFLPLLFSGNLFQKKYLLSALLAFAAFSMVASAMYVLNDLRDKRLDALHPRNKRRPIASGEVGAPAAIITMAVLLGIAAILQYLAGFTPIGVGLLLFYIVMNVSYSFGLKNVPIIDVTILSLGFVIRVLYGGYSVGIEVSKWLYLAVLAFSFYLGLGKRRNEIRANGAATRKVNKYYNQDFLDKNMYVCLGLTLVYYSLWAIDPSQTHKLIYLTIPLVIVITMAYSLTVERVDSDGDPVSALLSSKPLLMLVALYGLLIVGLVYVRA